MIAQRGQVDEGRQLCSVVFGQIAATQIRKAEILLASPESNTESTLVACAARRHTRRMPMTARFGSSEICIFRCLFMSISRVVGSRVNGLPCNGR